MSCCRPFPLHAGVPSSFLLEPSGPIDKPGFVTGGIRGTGSYDSDFLKSDMRVDPVLVLGAAAFDLIGRRSGKTCRCYEARESAGQ